MDDETAAGESAATMVALEGSFVATLPSRLHDRVTLVGVVIVGLPLLVLLARGVSLWSVVPVLNLWLMPLIVAFSGESGGEVHVDGSGIRGGENGDRLTWPYIDRIELADVHRWSPATRVIGRYGNLVTIPARSQADGHDAHPAELIHREAAARGIEVVGSRHVATPVERLRAPALITAIAVLLAAVFPFST